jgi:arylsulfatase A-like enzyme
VTADHGELIGEQGKIGHGKYLYQKELHIPLIMKYPGSEYRYKQEDVRLQLMDVFCMILDRLSISIPPEAQGSVPPSITHPIFAEIYPPPALSRNGDWRAFFSENFKFLWNSKGNNMLFNPDDDPTESVNLIDKYPDRAKKMELEMNTFIASLPKPDPPMPVQEIDKETKEALKSLGYVK